jgi:hypothetical protein
VDECKPLVRGLSLRCPAAAELAAALSAPPHRGGPAIGANLYCTPAGWASHAPPFPW